MADEKKTVLVISAHAADFVWRAGGAIALYADRGYHVRIVCLSYGERGESERYECESHREEQQRKNVFEALPAATRIVHGEAHEPDCRQRDQQRE